VGQRALGSRGSLPRLRSPGGAGLPQDGRLLAGEHGGDPQQRLAPPGDGRHPRLHARSGAGRPVCVGRSAGDAGADAAPVHCRSVGHPAVGRHVARAVRSRRAGESQSGGGGHRLVADDHAGRLAGVAAAVRRVPRAGGPRFSGGAYRGLAAGCVDRVGWRLARAADLVTDRAGGDPLDAGGAGAARRVAPARGAVALSARELAAPAAG